MEFIMICTAAHVQPLYGCEHPARGRSSAESACARSHLGCARLCASAGLRRCGFGSQTYVMFLDVCCVSEGRLHRCVEKVQGRRLNMPLSYGACGLIRFKVKAHRSDRRRSGSNPSHSGPRSTAEQPSLQLSRRPRKYPTLYSYFEYAKSSVNYVPVTEAVKADNSIS
ncbi:hypothetical protein EVAR_44408_1 [Eumeta japonica]|uniref:Uncharacterized protein n=1 Tax=Eumeta variegata TaxID=151549 RepID=A0A4C1XRT2_EUMVA|nr:hypothetical protein EVAR_44408_1 [Eumeta japonica]